MKKTISDVKYEEKIKRLINTAYHVCKSECPFTDYSKLIVLQEKNGLDMGNFYRSDNACRRFVKTVYDDLVSTPLGMLRTDVNFFTILIDGATDVSVTENELIYIRLLQDGIPANKYFSIEDVESADSAGVLNSINEAFDRHGLPDWKEKLIGFGSDGASVNLGNRSGVAKQIKDEVLHLIITHCVAYRLELAANNAIKHHKIMLEIQDILQHMYKHYHYSPKALRELRKLAEALEEKILKPTNLSGTCWLPFIESALHVLVVDFRVILAYFEHVESRTGSAEVQGQAHFISKKLKENKFLYLTFFVLDILKVLNILSKTMQRDDLTLSQLFDALTTAHPSLAELRSTNGNQLSNFLSEHGENYATIKQEMLDLICKALDDRFGPTEKVPLLLAAAKLTDFNDWLKDIQNLATFGQEQLNLLLQHFQDILNRSGCDLKLSKMNGLISKHTSTDTNQQTSAHFLLMTILKLDSRICCSCWRSYSEASKYLVDVLNLINEVQREDCLDKIIESVQKQQLSSTLIDRSVCEQAVQECNTDQDESDNVFGVIDAFAVPRFTYVTDRKKFIESDTVGIPPPCLHGTAEDKNRLFTNKYTMLLQRTQRHDLFTPPVIGAQMDQNSKKFQLKPIEYLLGSTAKLGEIIVLGMLTQLKEGKWYLEDPTGVVQIDLSEASFQNGLFTENCFVLAEGWYEDKIFHINAFGFPPPEPAKTTRSYFGNINFFGGFGNQCAKASSKLRQIEQDNEDAMFVFLSDVWLDQVKVMEKLRILFAGYADFPPTCFYIMWKFSIITPG
ncbi:POLE2 [Mytilus coruscus]|uniref:POLE2 n=1 Tax=Mytilus coruscus TaxID=42192 RepID=A0A6J8AZ70_MYTCO|nr:POLE2 [Mytilus coruscus]